jgi:xanthine/uracil/vitamin C permease (AzgA family)
MTTDPLIAESEEAEEAAQQTEREARAANLFDLRRIIGALFAVYGVILTIVGLTTSDAEIKKAAGININLWTGLAMLVVAAIFIGWALSRPLSEQLDE